MKSIKIYLVVVTVLLFIAIGFGVYAWYTIQKLEREVGGVRDTTSVSIRPISPTTATSEVDSNTSVTASETVTEPIVVQKSELGATQQKMLETFGFEGETITITPTMIACAEDAVGKERLNEIINGAAPGPIESIKLLPCFKS